MSFTVSLLKTKCLIYPTGCGPAGYHLFVLKNCIAAPKAIINIKPFYQQVGDAISSDLPMLYGFDLSLLDIIQTDDWVSVDADIGVITIKRNHSDQSSHTINRPEKRSIFVKYAS